MDNSGSAVGSIYNNGIIESDNLPGDIIFVATHAKCGDSEGDYPNYIKTSGINDFALQIRLEGGSIYCVDNS